jgi:hypothetical protein
MLTADANARTAPHLVEPEGLQLRAILSKLTVESFASSFGYSSLPLVRIPVLVCQAAALRVLFGLKAGWPPCGCGLVCCVVRNGFEGDARLGALDGANRKLLPLHELLQFRVSRGSCIGGSFGRELKGFSSRPLP